jgi:hypothetical protein
MDIVKQVEPPDVYLYNLKIGICQAEPDPYPDYLQQQSAQRRMSSPAKSVEPSR